ncbi:hypothetical protein [Sporisorium scitamineum]|uniref:DNA replication regulator SLD2 n=1 Tax=Sporisorium scitamineum TaxID=49012 RepID=A0A0F7RT63_9BASI|nr:hypothetical protein [Sporisorium scitamineum]
MEQLLRRELKSWQKAFKAQHGRDPTKRDILADPAIAGTYDTWQAAGGDAKAKSKSRSSAGPRSSDASSSKQRLDGQEEVFKTPSKRKSSRSTGEAEGAARTPSRNPFRTPTKAKLSPTAVTPGAGGRSKNPFASPSKPNTTTAEPPSPARSLIEVEMTPTKRSPLLDTFARRNTFTPTKSPSHRHHQQERYITSSPTKLRSTLKASLPSKRTPTKGPQTRAQSDAALNAALVAYTPRTKARKRLRGEDVPPTPSRRVVSGSAAVARTDPRSAQRGLGAFGFASSRKATQDKGSGTVPNLASVFSRARSAQSNGKPSRSLADDEEEEEMQTESPIKAVAKLRRSASAKGFRPLFASPSGNHAPQNVFGVPPPPKPGANQNEGDDDLDALMDDNATSPVGGLFAAQVQQNRLRRARETESASVDPTEAVKKHKVRAPVQLPSSNYSDDEVARSSSPAFRRGAASSSPHTELTVPSSTVRPTADHFLSKQSRVVEADGSPTRAVADKNDVESKAVETGNGVEAWRKVHRVELSDEDKPHKPGSKKVISITPYQRYGTLHSSSPLPPSTLDEEEEDYTYTIPIANRRVYAVDLPSNSSSDSEDDTHASLAGLKLSPVRHTRLKARERERLLNGIFDPSSSKTRTVFNPEARFGPLQPSTRTLDSDYQEVDQDFTFLDSEIELQDIA